MCTGPLVRGGRKGDRLDRGLKPSHGRPPPPRPDIGACPARALARLPTCLGSAVRRLCRRLLPRFLACPTLWPCWTQWPPAPPAAVFCRPCLRMAGIAARRLCRRQPACLRCMRRQRHWPVGQGGGGRPPWARRRQRRCAFFCRRMPGLRPCSPTQPPFHPLHAPPPCHTADNAPGGSNAPPPCCRLLRPRLRPLATGLPAAATRRRPAAPAATQRRRSSPLPAATAPPPRRLLPQCRQDRGRQRSHAEATRAFLAPSPASPYRLCKNPWRPPSFSCTRRLALGAAANRGARRAASASRTARSAAPPPHPVVEPQTAAPASGRRAQSAFALLDKRLEKFDTAPFMRAAPGRP